MEKRRSDPSDHTLYMREWRSRNREKWDAYMADYRSRNRDRLVAYRKDHRLEIKARKHQYLGRKYGAVGKYTAAEFRSVIALYGGLCAYCGQPPREGYRLEADHAMPLSRGGTNSIENILPACHSCNTSKSDRTSEEFRSGVLYKRAAPIPKDPDGHKTCSVCKRVLPFSSYWKNSARRIGIMPMCKECGYAKHKAYLAKPEARVKRRASANRWYANRDKPIE